MTITISTTSTESTIPKAYASSAPLACLRQKKQKNDTTETALASGSLAQSASIITILADVHGPGITVTINGEQVATASDPNYSTTSFLAFGVADAGATSNPSALFSNFVYTPQ